MYYNDQFVHVITDENILIHENAYILVYEKIEEIS
jgi:ubiquitin C-terminal hydrolase